MTPRIVTFDMCELRRAPKRLAIPVQIPQPLVNMGKATSDIPYIRLEMLYVNGIESYYRRE